jgi:hypothetical protein
MQLKESILGQHQVFRCGEATLLIPVCVEAGNINLERHRQFKEQTRGYHEIGVV